MAEVAVNNSWKIDPVHSEIHFKVRHMMVSTVTGSFNEFEGAAEATGDGFEDATISFSANVNSLDTKNGDRDAHLKSDDFFNAETYPKLTFQSKTFRKTSEGIYELVGDLTIRDKTHEVILDTQYFGSAVDPYGQTKAGFELAGKINRKDFELKWNAVTEAGGVVVSDEVRLVMNVQLVKQ